MTCTWPPQSQLPLSGTTTTASSTPPFSSSSFCFAFDHGMDVDDFCASEEKKGDLSHYKQKRVKQITLRTQDRGTVMVKLGFDMLSNIINAEWVTTKPTRLSRNSFCVCPSPFSPARRQVLAAPYCCGSFGSRHLPMGAPMQGKSRYERASRLS